MSIITRIINSLMDINATSNLNNIKKQAARINKLQSRLPGKK